MGGYYGSAATTLKNNKDLLGKKNRPGRKDYIGTKDVPAEDPIKANPELLREIRKKIQKENKKRKKTQILVALLSLFITVLIIYANSNIEWVGINLNRIVWLINLI